MLPCVKPKLRNRYTPKNVVKKVKPALNRNDEASTTRSRGEVKPRTTLCTDVPSAMCLSASLWRMVSGKRVRMSATFTTHSSAANQNGVVAENHDGVVNSP